MNPTEILKDALVRAEKAKKSFIEDTDIRGRVDYVCRCASNRAGARLLMACMLGKIDNPAVDPRKPYTEIGGKDSFSGRTYDERYLTAFVNEHELPVNPTTAFLTPTLRNIGHPLTTERELVGRPRDLYKKTLELLEVVAEGRVDANVILREEIRILLEMRDERRTRMNSLLVSLGQSGDAPALSSEEIVNLLAQHLACKNSSRLPVLIVAAAYKAVGQCLFEDMLPLKSHNAADVQTGAIGDVEICLVGDDAVVTVYEMKMKRVTQNDIDAAVAKIIRAGRKIDNYLFITTDIVEPQIAKYAATFYEKTDGVEIAILDCIGFIRHFLHFFHRFRKDYLDAYQKLLLSEPDSAVSPVLKEAFLVLRQTAET
jgi:hypothetical protein